jgi:hypothetical protein
VDVNFCFLSKRVCRSCVDKGHISLSQLSYSLRA